MTETLRSFGTLDCWQACRLLRVFIAEEIVPALPRDEKYRFADQFLRAARSTTANIAEGYGRFHYLDSAKFCSNARGSAYEVLDHLIAAHDEGLISDPLVSRGEALVETAIRLLNGYIRYLQNQARTHTVREDAAAYSVKEGAVSDSLALDSLVSLGGEEEGGADSPPNETNPRRHVSFEIGDSFHSEETTLSPHPMNPMNPLPPIPNKPMKQIPNPPNPQ